MRDERRRVVQDRHGERTKADGDEDGGNLEAESHFWA
jgi:hypothetical protein